MKKKLNTKTLSYRLNLKQDLKKITENYPKKFIKWAKNYIESHHALIIKSDFILSDSDSLEIKRGKDSLDSPNIKQQSYRILLYKILTQQEINIQIITLHPINDSTTTPGIEYRYFFDSTYTNKLEKSDLDEIYKWEKKIAKLEK